jgi:two-component system KDP operon response regulator KdpE
MTRAMRRVLVIEDDPAQRRVLSILFETNGFRVVAADTCELAIRQARTHRPDVCIVDLGLPDRDGLNFIRQIRSWSPVPIIVLTARVQEDQRLAAFDAGADDYVTKCAPSFAAPFAVRSPMQSCTSALRSSILATARLVARAAKT